MHERDLENLILTCGGAGRDGVQRGRRGGGGVNSSYLYHVALCFPENRELIPFKLVELFKMHIS